MNILEKLKEKGYDTIPAEFYSRIDLWKSWYDGDVRNFHNYRVFNGQKTVQCRRYTLGMGKKVAEDWANLLMNEKVRITLEGREEQSFFDSVCKDNNFAVKINEMQEMKAALGTTAYVVRAVGVTANDSTGKILGFGRGKVKIDYVTAPDIFPLSWENGTVKECAFSSGKTVAGERYRYLSVHRAGRDGNYILENSLYHDNNGSLTEAALTNVPGFETIPPVVNTGSPKRPFVIDRLTIANNYDHALPMGIPVFANAIDQLKGVDVVYDSYINEFILGKKRVMIQPGATKTLEGDPVFDPNDVVFYVLPEDIKDGTIIDAIEMSIQAQDHNTGLRDMLNIK